MKSPSAVHRDYLFLLAIICLYSMLAARRC